MRVEITFRNLKEYEKQYVIANIMYMKERSVFVAWKTVEKIRDDKRLAKKIAEKILQGFGKIAKGIEATPEFAEKLYREMAEKGVLTDLNVVEGKDSLQITFDTVHYDVSDTWNKFVRWKLTRTLDRFLKDLMKELNSEAEYSLKVSDPEVAL